MANLENRGPKGKLVVNKYNLDAQLAINDDHNHGVIPMCYPYDRTEDAILMK